MSTMPDSHVLLPYREAFNLVGRRWEETPGWLMERREAAWRRFAENGFSLQRHEAWKYTPLSAFAETVFQRAPEALLGPRQIEPFIPFGFKGPVAVFVNGRFQPALSRLDHLPEGATLTSLHAALALWPKELEPHLLLLAADEDNPFAILNGALAEDGAFLHVRAGVTVDEPVLLLKLAQGGRAPLMSHLRHLVVAEEGSRVAVAACHGALDEGVHFSDSLAEIVVGADARVEWLRLQEANANTYPFGQLRARVARDGRFDGRIFSLGGRLAREDWHVELAGEGAECHMDGLLLADGTRVADVHTRIDHMAARTLSRERFKGIVGGRGRGVFDGRVVVQRDAQKADAQLSSRNLLLSPDGEMDAKPQLEIFANDVKCSHGATVGQLDENQVFYLRSRGLDMASARAVLTYAFAADLLRAVPYPCFREAAGRRLAARLPGGEMAREFFHDG